MRTWFMSLDVGVGFGQQCQTNLEQSMGLRHHSMVQSGPWIQPVAATHALNRSAGVSYPSVFRGLSLSCLATALSFA